MTFDDWLGSVVPYAPDDDIPSPGVLPLRFLSDDMTAQDIADAVLKQPTFTPERFAKLARLVETKEKLRAVVLLLPEDMRAGIVAGMQSLVK